MSMKNFQWRHQESKPLNFRLVAQCLNQPRAPFKLAPLWVYQLRVKASVICRHSAISTLPLWSLNCETNFKNYFDSAYFNTAYFSTAYFDTAYFDTAYFDTAYFDTAYFNTAYFDTAYFNTAYFTVYFDTAYFDTLF